ncbi:DNA alkylation repair enzyme [hydrothermal vent metagenome]|uniref:DNA alkylation repair enzyme n=1 Tax=hydrothermal vent metagenome TaxID=652676 RepID=A0A3B0RJQ3_9ZZZZ
MEPFKNVFSPELVACMATHLQQKLPAFDRDAFETPILEQLETLELKQRAQLIADHWHQCLPTDPKQRAEILLDVLHPDELDHANQPSDAQGICGWGVFPLTMVVGQHGTQDFVRSMDVLRQMTKRFSSEFGIRYFLLADQKQALHIMQSWLNERNYHVRRLISEGSRPRLPWAMQLPALIADPAPILPLLSHLRDDEHEYVRRSVANSLNDIAKDHPDLMGKLANDWMKGANKPRQKLVRHACRTLIKQGHVATLQAFGIFAPKIKLNKLCVQPAIVQFGEKLEFSCQIQSICDKPQDLIVDYILHFKKANGKLAAKVFKCSKFTLQAKQTRTLQRQHAIRPISTRRYYQGKQALSLRINGKDFGYQEFDLSMD